MSPVAVAPGFITSFPLHWGVGQFCFSLLARNHLFLKSLLWKQGEKQNQPHIPQWQRKTERVLLTDIKYWFDSARSGHIPKEASLGFCLEPPHAGHLAMDSLAGLQGAVHAPHPCAVIPPPWSQNKSHTPWSQSEGGYKLSLNVWAFVYMHLGNLNHSFHKRPTHNPKRVFLCLSLQCLILKAKPKRVPSTHHQLFQVIPGSSLLFTTDLFVWQLLLLHRCASLSHPNVDRDGFAKHLQISSTDLLQPPFLLLSIDTG